MNVSARIKTTVAALLILLLVSLASEPVVKGWTIFVKFSELTR